MSENYIAVTCPNCLKQLRAPLKAAGKTGRCAGCGTQLQIPSGGQVSTERTGPTAAEPDAHGNKLNRPPATKKSHHPPKKNRPLSVDSSAATDRLSLEPSELDCAATSNSQDFNDAIEALIAIGNRQAAARAQDRLSVDEVTKAVAQQLRKRPVSLAYRLQLLLVACAMTALPILYIAFVAVAGVSVFMYATRVVPSLMSHIPAGRIAILYAAAVASPAVAGSIMVLFLFKPLFFRAHDERRRRSLTRLSQPLLFEFIDRICFATGAPTPERIDVDYQVNASAQPLNGVWSVAAGRMVLTIGLPLAGGLSARQLAGVVGHEFGHFSQKMGMGASLIIRRVNFWFARVVYQRDELDATLESWIADSDWRIGLVLQLASLGVMFSRAVLWCFMMLGHVISAGLMRQMEFDADRYEYGLVGSRTFEQTSFELRMLSIAQAAAHQVLHEFFLKGRLADDMIFLGDHCRNQLPPEIRRGIETAHREEKQSWLATHPIDRVRVARANAASEEGIFHLDRPARELFRHYDEICKGVTWDFYRDQLGSHVTPQQLVPTRQLMQATDHG